MTAFRFILVIFLAYSAVTDALVKETHNGPSSAVPSGLDSSPSQFRRSVMAIFHCWELSNTNSTFMRVAYFGFINRESDAIRLPNDTAVNSFEPASKTQALQVVTNFLSGDNRFSVAVLTNETSLIWRLDRSSVTADLADESARCPNRLTFHMTFATDPVGNEVIVAALMKGNLTTLTGLPSESFALNITARAPTRNMQATRLAVITTVDVPGSTAANALAKLVAVSRTTDFVDSISSAYGSSPSTAQALATGSDKMAEDPDVADPPVTGSAPTSSASEPPIATTSPKLTPGAIAGIVIACVLGLVVILIIVYVIASNPKKAPQASEPTRRPNDGTEPAELPKRHPATPEDRSASSDESAYEAEEFSEDEDEEPWDEEEDESDFEDSVSSEGDEPLPPESHQRTPV